MNFIIDYLFIPGILLVIGFFIITLTLVLVLGILDMFIDLDDLTDDIKDIIKKLINKYNKNITVGSVWGNGQFEIIKIALEFPDTESIIMKEYRVDKDKVLMIYVMNKSTKEVTKYPEDLFKKCFKK